MKKRGLKSFREVLLACFIFTMFICLSDLATVGAKEVEAGDLFAIENYINVYLKIGSAIVLVFSLGTFTYNIIKLGASSTNIQMRQQAIRGLILSGIAGAVLPMTLLIHNIILSFL